MKKLSHVERVMQLAQKKPDGFTIAEAHAACKDAGKNTVSAMMWGLKKKGVMLHDKANHVYKLAPDRLTPVNKDAPQPGTDEARAEWKEQLSSATMQAASASVQKVTNSYNVLMQRYNTLQEQHQDALAIIRYLENKLYIVIQQTNNGRNP